MFEEIVTIIKHRRSIRNFIKRPVEIGTVKKIIEAASHAPSNNNRQGWRFYVVNNHSVVKKIEHVVLDKLGKARGKSGVINEALEVYGKNFTAFKSAPIVIVCCFVKPNRFTARAFETDIENNHLTGELISLSLAMQNIMLVSESLDLGTLIMTAPLIAAREIRDLLGIQPKWSIGAFICMGYYDKKPDSPDHLPLEKILHIIS